MYELFFSQYQKLNIPSTLDDLNKISYIIKEKVDLIKEDIETRQYFIWVYELMICGEDYLNLRNCNPKGIVNYLEYSNGYKIPDIDKFEDERIEFYTTYIKKENNLHIKIRFLNYLYDKSKKKYEYAKELCECLKKYYEMEESSLKHLYILSRLLDISLKLNFTDYIEFCKKVLIAKIFKFKEQKKYEFPSGFYYLLFKACFVKRKLIIDKLVLNEIVDVIKDSIDYFESVEEYMLCEMCAWELYEWYKIMDISQDTIDALLVYIGEIYEKQAIKQFGREQISNHIAATYFEKAIEHYSKYGIRTKIHDLKVRIKKSYREGKKELTEQICNFDYMNDTLKREIQQFNSGNLDKDIHNLAIFLSRSIETSSNNLFPNYEISLLKAKKRIEDPIW